VRDRVPFGARGHFLSVVCGADLLKMKLSSLAGRFHFGYYSSCTQSNTIRLFGR
jgi:hypothetical protein